MTTKTETEGRDQATLGRRDMLKVTAAAGAATAITAVAPSRARAQTVCTGLDANEKYPVSPLILNPFTDPLPVPSAVRPTPASVVATWVNQPGPEIGRQDADGGTHQLYPGQAGTLAANMPAPSVYWMQMRVNSHAYTTSPVRTLVPFRNLAGRRVAAGTVVPRLPETTIYGFNGTFYSTLVNAEYGKPNLMRGTWTAATTARRSSASSPTCTTATPPPSRTATRTTSSPAGSPASGSTPCT
jgi:hypothetical protein